MNKEVHMQVGARHIGQLGRELVTDYVTALTELVKNSYDADAEAVEIIFENLKTGSGRITLIDTGSGISSDDVINKWAVIGTNNKIKETHSPIYGRRYAGKKGIGRFAVERLAEYCTILSFTKNERFEYKNNWNLYEGINIPETIQRCGILKITDDISCAKYLKTAIEYLLLTSNIEKEDKDNIREFFGTKEITYKHFLGNPLWISAFEEFIVPILEKYKEKEQMIQEVSSTISDSDACKLDSYNNILNNVYSENNIKKETKTGTVIILDNLRDLWGQSDIERIIKELILLVAPSRSKDDNFKIVIKADEFKDLERVELTNEVLGLAYAEVIAFFKDTEIDNDIVKQFIVEYKEVNSDKKKIIPITVDLPFLCGEFSLHLYYFVREQKYLKKGAINQSLARKVLDTFCGVKIYRDGFRVRPYGDIGNDWLLLDSKKIKDTHGYLVGNNQLIGEIEVSQEKNPLLVDSTNREAIIENESFFQLRNYVTKAIQVIQSTRYEDFKEEEKRRNEEQTKRENDLKKQHARADKSVQQYLAQIKEAASKGEIKNIAEISTQLAGVVSEERQRSSEYINETKIYYEGQIEAKDRELSLYKNLASLGILAGSFGHETVDVFSRIKNDIGILDDTYRMLGIPNVENCFKRLFKDIDRVGSYSKILLSFLKKNKREKIEYFDWANSIKILLDLYRKIIESYNINLDMSQVKIVKEPIKIYQIDFESIIINLVTNSFEAVKSEENKIIKISLSEDIDKVVITVEDSGKGIPENKYDWVFKPFNTTKKEDGVGLGLTIVNDIVEKYKGEIEISKSDMGGAKFDISFVKKQ